LVLTVISVPVNLVNMANAQGNEVEALAVLGSGIFQIVISIIIIIGAQKMKRLESHSFARTAAILSFIPCISPCCLLGLVFGIQVNNLLNDPQVREPFTS